MPPKQCLYCWRPAVSGRSRCSVHGPTSPKGPRLHDSRQTVFAKTVLERAKRENRWYCHECGTPPTQNDPLQAGPIVPLSLGGSFDPANGQPEHRSCNVRKGGANRKRSRVFF
jgi:hypothetical protein